VSAVGPAVTSTTVVLVRPWTDGHGGGGCCGGQVRDGVCLDGSRHRTDAPTDAAVDPVGEAWRALRAQVPQVDVQVVDAGNTVWLLPHVFTAVRREAGVRAGLRAALGSTAAGAVLVDGRRVGDLEQLGADGVVAAVRARMEAARAAH
jgi:hypothetical protein